LYSLYRSSVPPSQFPRAELAFAAINSPILIGLPPPLTVYRTVVCAKLVTNGPQLARSVSRLAGVLLRTKSSLMFRI